MTTYPIHPACDLFPMMSAAELRELANDIKANGQLEPIELFNEMVLDGKNRQKACEMAALEPRFVSLSDDISPTTYSVAKNLHRRHLTLSQRSSIGAEAIPMLQKEARKRQATSTGGKNPQLVTKSSQADKPNNSNQTKGKSRKFAAALVGVGAGSIQRAATVRRENPELHEKVKAGEVTLADAHREVAHKTMPEGTAPAEKRNNPPPLTRFHEVIELLERLERVGNGSVSKFCRLFLRHAKGKMPYQKLLADLEDL